jgi:UDP-GlcNAc:undecaprenyl-phosphate GlcNAc-1-phosphate transferase
MMPVIFMLLSCAFASALVPMVINFAHSKSLYDRTSERKVHNGSIPRLGGVGIALAFLMAMLVLIITQDTLAEEFSASFRVWPILITGTIMFILGLVDDLFDLRAMFKFSIQIIAAATLILVGFRFRVILVPWGNGIIQLGFFSFPLTFLWIIGITNAINLIDGLDGLAGGICLIAASTFGIFFWVRGMILSAEICMAIAGAVAGFLIFNLPPAKVFMGDCGSLFLGFSLSMLPLLGQSSHGAEIGMISAATILSIPIFDTFVAIYRRKATNKPFFSADKGHFHHIMLDRYKSTSKVIAIIYGINVFLSMIALSSLYADGSLSFFLKIAALMAIALSFFILNKKNMKKIREKNSTTA